jgi:cobalt/nickel transport system permease protein
MAGGHAHGGAHGPVGDLASPVHRLDPRAKILGLVGVTVVGVSTPASAWPVWVACAAVLVAVAAAGRVPPRALWRRSRTVLPLVVAAAVFVPFAREGPVAFSVGPFDASREGLEVLLSVAVKAAIGTVSAVLLAATTSVPEVIRGLEAMRVPRLLILVATFMYRYLFVIAGELGRMRAALAARAYRPRHLLQIAPLGRMVSALFLRSYARGERVYLAMQARGFTGEMPRAEPLRLGRTDAVFVAVVVLALVPLRTVLGAHP